MKLSQLFWCTFKEIVTCRRDRLRCVTCLDHIFVNTLNLQIITPLPTVPLPLTALRSIYKKH